MRVITGKAKGRKLEIPKLNNLRPTTDRVKEGIFSIIQFDIPKSRFLDLFGGSGQMGIEALSRGALRATFVDFQTKACNIIKQNLKMTNFDGNADVVCMDSITFLSSCKGVFDIAFLDPPYKTGILQKTLFGLTKNMSEKGIIICESSLDDDLPENVNDFFMFKKFKYGKIKVSVYKPKGRE